MTTSAPEVAPAAEDASVAPLPTRPVAFPGERFHTVTSCPSARRRPASACPIRPNPSTAIRMAAMLGLRPVVADQPVVADDQYR
jgi:hypothetical protein